MIPILSRIAKVFRREPKLPERARPAIPLVIPADVLAILADGSHRLEVLKFDAEKYPNGAPPPYEMPPFQTTAGVEHEFLCRAIKTGDDQ
ncbi:hypothetical protein ACFODL_15460 [Phenylobacterium terrae]|uniref:Uncharacterized protein n=1 Tax=Phenylobacterium terrae TaxID=2665495 RepID=A0ABW4N6K8_9CAUL